MNSVLAFEKEIVEKSRYLDLIKKECQDYPMTKTMPVLKQPENFQDQEEDLVMAVQDKLKFIRKLTDNGPAVPTPVKLSEKQEIVEIPKVVQSKEVDRKTKLLHAMPSYLVGSIFLRSNYVEKFRRRTAQRNELNRKRLNEAHQLYLKAKQKRIAYEAGRHKKLILTHSVHVIEEIPISSELIPLTKEHHDWLMELSKCPLQEVIVTKFKLDIRGSDIKILTDGAWLNDIIINFYMNLLTERSEKRSGQVPSVYAMSTFFVPRLLQSGFDGVKRWTRTVDLFSKDIILVPVHYNGVHWCLVIIDLPAKTMLYYNSRGRGNPKLMRALVNYLQMESTDKRGLLLDTSDFRIEDAQNVPQQGNTNDCGVFVCMFAEYRTRDAPITFCQKDMKYFRTKMVLELTSSQLWK
ncbi:sentrin-specific protease 2 [Drosophila sechellia]|uniref:sentrin-specific protease 2 n=1 Tax=Drosophila sechellia TaxID=7238 RepID=UPI0013DDFE8B|nr:sentrin-specific protease 2 [Drosophila sechellia]